jgi:hypothetical protein
MQCHCYVCDKPAPCFLWGQGNSMSDHCHASDKEDKWSKLRHSYKQMISPSIVDDVIPRLSSSKSTVLVSRRSTRIPSNIFQNAASQFRPSSLTDPVSSGGPFSSASSMNSIDPHSIGRRTSSRRFIYNMHASSRDSLQIHLTTDQYNYEVQTTIQSFNNQG